MSEEPQKPLEIAPDWAARTKAALEHFRATASKQQRGKMSMIHRDVEREVSWHDQQLAKDKLTEEQYWNAVAKTLREHGVTQA